MDIHMSPPSWTSLPPPTPSIPSVVIAPLFEFPESYSKFPLVIFFAYGSVYVSMLLSPFVSLSPSPAPTLHIHVCSLCLHLHCSTYIQFNTAAKSLQSCPTLCDPIDGSPLGSPVPGILQARTLEWVAISFSNSSEFWSQLYCIQLCNLGQVI